ncbi:DMT family transporter [Oscillospiraceae bacterium CM]|nr:DMT family transporter [Oscillospiraceae bacterium CM]
MKNHDQALGRAALFLATLIWGISFVLMDVTLTHMGAFFILAIRFLGAAAVMLPFAARDFKKLDKRYLTSGVIMGLLLLAAYAFQTFGLALTTPGKNAFLTAVYCIIVPFLYWAFRRKRPHAFNIAAAAICIVGGGLISLDGSLRLGLGDGLTLVCGLVFAVHIVVTGAAVRNRSTVLVAMLQFAVAGALALILALLFEPAPVNLSAETVWGLVFLTVVSTALCLFLQTFGQKHTPPAQASVIMALEAVFGAAASVLFTGEVLTVKLTVGFMLTFAAVIISETKLSFFKAGWQQIRDSQ